MLVEKMLLKAIVYVEAVQFNKGRYAVVGANGAGKTMFLRALAGSVMPDSGSLSIDSYRVIFPVNFLNIARYRKKLRKNVFYIETQDYLYGNWTLRQNIKYYSEIIDYSNERLWTCLECFNLIDLLDRQVDKLSLGTRQKVSISLLLSSNKEILIMDEPTLGLDYNSKKIFEKMMMEISENHVIIISTNDRDIMNGFDNYVICDKKEVIITDVEPYAEIAN